MKKVFILGLIIPFSLSLSACEKSEAQKKEACVNILQKEGAFSPNFAKNPICQKLSNKEIDDLIARHPSQNNAQIKTQEQQLLAHPDNSTIKDDGKNLIANGF